ncbi:putative phage abortive infection protein [Pseudomonas alkylphenolica]|uniref:putative phage abortive infection protein n=1 Tax=Pseudomonas alkylphenolica TaxID=237609 RepID=UPI0012F6828D|nr:putative phage abortive infection protein [Pseudomonas alkylphenolica]
MARDIERNVKGSNGIGRTISFIVLLAIVAVCAVCGVIGVHYFAGIDIPIVSLVNEGSAQYWGQLGDFFGGVLNPLLSFLALVAVATSLRVQALELNAARQEAAAAQDMLANQTKVLERQQAVLERQNFESNFYGLLQVHDRNLQGVRLHFGSEPDVGRLAFGALANRFNVDRVDFTYLNEELSRQAVKDHVKKFYSQSYLELGHYFRTLYEIFNYIESYGNENFAYFNPQGFSAPIDAEKQALRWRYGGLVASLLSSAELECMFLYCMAIEGIGLKAYVEKYGLFRNLPPRTNYANPALSSAYSSSAYSVL